MECQEIVEEDDILSLINWDDLPDFAPPFADSPSGSVSSWIGEVENLLLKDDGDGVELVPDSQIPDEFFRDIFVDSPSSSAEVIGGSAGGNPPDVSVERSGSGDGCPPEPRGNIPVRETEPDGFADKVSDPPISVADGSDGGLEKLQEIDEDDPVSKKRKRQLRNRDAAVKSRERKKMYVRDLETKSRYMERECLRLGRLLQCFIAENQVLRLSLQNDSAFDVSSTKQESAVLLLESLLLGSLLWFLGIMWLFNPQAFPKSTLEPAPVENVEKKGPGSLVPKDSTPRSNAVVAAFLNSRKCKASRTKMKSDFLGLKFNPETCSASHFG